MTWGWGLSFFMTSSSDSKSFLSVSVALPRAKDNCPVTVKPYPNKHAFRTMNRVPFSIFMATVIVSSLPRRFEAFPWATWPKAPFPITFSIVTFCLSTSHELSFFFLTAAFLFNYMAPNKLLLTTETSHSYKYDQSLLSSNRIYGCSINF